jgi:hypothetical protein
VHRNWDGNSSLFKVVLLERSSKFHSVQAGTNEIFRTSYKTGTLYPFIPLQLKFHCVSVHSGHLGLLGPISVSIHISDGMGFFFSFSCVT